MAYPNVLMVDDGVCFYVMREAAKHGAVVCVHAENGYAINVLVERGGRGRQPRAEVPLPDPPARTRGRGDRARDHARRIRRRAALRRPRHLQPGARRGRARQGPLRPDPRRDLHAVPLPDQPGAGAAGLRGRQIRVHAAAAQPGAPGRALAGPAARRPLGGLDRPLPVLLRRAALRHEVLQAPGRGGGLPQDPERRPRHRAPLFRCSSTAP